MESVLEIPQFYYLFYSYIKFSGSFFPKMQSSSVMPIMPVLQGPFGGNGGEEFNDLIQLNPAVTLRSGIVIQEINVRAGDYVDSIQVTYHFSNNTTRSLDRRGGTGGSFSKITLEEDEVLVKVEGKINGQLIGQLIFTSRRTNGDERKHGPYGNTGTTPFSTEGLIMAFSGRSCGTLDSLGVYSFALPTLESEEVGGSGGSPWDDVLNQNLKPFEIQGIAVSYGNQVDSIQTTYRFFDGSLHQAPRRGGTGGSRSATIQFADGEKLTKIEGKTNGVLIDQLTFNTVCRNGTAKVYGPYGKTGRTPFSFEGPILGLRGRSGTLLDALGVYYKSESLSHFRTHDLFGGSGGSPWDDNIGILHPIVIGIKCIKIYSGSQVDGLQVVYRQADGSETQGIHHGGHGGSLSVVTLEKDEQIIRIEGKTNGVLIDQLTFIVKSGEGKETRLGPFGKTGTTPFSVDGHIVGFIGRSGSLMDGLGVYLSVN